MAHVYDEYGSGDNESRNLPAKRSTSAPNLGPKGIHLLMNEEYYQSNGCSDLESEHNVFITVNDPFYFIKIN